MEEVLYFGIATILFGLIYSKFSYRQKQRKSLSIFIYIVGSLLICFYLFHKIITPNNEEINVYKSNFLNLKSSEIQCIRVNSDTLINKINLFNNEKLICDQEKLSPFINALQSIEVYSPNHPTCIWKVYLEIELQNQNSINLEVMKSDQTNGSLIYLVWKNNNTTLYIETYRLDFIEEIIINW